VRLPTLTYSTSESWLIGCTTQISSLTAGSRKPGGLNPSLLQPFFQSKVMNALKWQDWFGPNYTSGKSQANLMIYQNGLWNSFPLNMWTKTRRFSVYFLLLLILWLPHKLST
jgi:hypothetical protein